MVIMVGSWARRSLCSVPPAGSAAALRVAVRACASKCCCDRPTNVHADNSPSPCKCPLTLICPLLARSAPRTGCAHNLT